MDGFVLDVSACMPWCCEDETTEKSEDLLAHAANGVSLHVPALWVWEVSNAVAISVKRQRISNDHGKNFLRHLSSFNLKIDPPPSIDELPGIYEFAASHRLTAYDASYLDLAKRPALPLATSYHELRKAALTLRISIF